MPLLLSDKGRGGGRASRACQRLLQRAALSQLQGRVVLLRGREVGWGALHCSLQHCQQACGQGWRCHAHLLLLLLLLLLSLWCWRCLCCLCLVVAAPPHHLPATPRHCTPAPALPQLQGRALPALQPSSCTAGEVEEGVLQHGSEAKQ